jgi:cbb3-type cytochrome oxidase subunit 3
MDPVTLVRIGSTIVMFLIFLGIVWWAYGSRRGARFDVAAHSVLRDDDAADVPFPGRRAK